MEPLTLALLVLPGDPGDLLGPVLEHPEVLLAKGRAVGKAVRGIFRALARGRLSELYPEWWGVWRYGPIISHRKVRLYCQTVYSPLLTTLAALLSAGLILIPLCHLGVIEEAWGYASAMSLVAAVLGVLPELAMAGDAVRAYLDAAFKGRSLEDCLYAFEMSGVYGLLITLTVYVAIAAVVITATRKHLRDFPLSVWVSSLVALIAPVITGIWTLWWGMWVVS